MPGYFHRVVILVPATKVTAVNNWVQNNLDPSGDPWFVNGLSPAGAAPATYYWCSVGLTDSQCILIVKQLLKMASITPPGDADSYTRQQIVTWLAAQRSAVFSVTGIWVDRCDNDGNNWNDPSGILALRGLQVIS